MTNELPGEDEMAGLPVERLIRDSVSVSMPSGEIQGWIASEQRRESRQTKRCWGLSLVVLLATCVVGGLLSAESQKVQRLVDKHPSKALTNLQQTTQELLGVAPAEYFVRQLAKPRSASRVSATTFSPTVPR